MFTSESKQGSLPWHCFWYLSFSSRSLVFLHYPGHRAKESYSAKLIQNNSLGLKNRGKIRNMLVHLRRVTKLHGPHSERTPRACHSDEGTQLNPSMPRMGTLWNCPLFPGPKESISRPKWKNHTSEECPSRAAQEAPHGNLGKPTKPSLHPFLPSKTRGRCR